jgi:hypothetical protein
MHRIERLAALVLAALAGCTADTTSSEARRLEVVEDVRIGSIDDPETSLTSVRTLRTDGAGRLYSIHSNEPFVRVHDEAGRPVMRIGREGEGPGEFQRPIGLGFVGDTLWVIDLDTYRFSYFEPATGEFLVARGMPIDLGSEGRNPARPNGLLADGSQIGSPPAWSREVAAGEMSEQVMVRMDWSGSAHDTIARWSIANTSWELTDRNSANSFAMYRQQPFSDAPFVRLTPGADAIIRVDRVAASDAPPFRVSMITLAGDTTWTREFEWSPIPIPDALADSVTGAFAAGLARASFASAPAVARGEELARASLYRPAVLPPVSDVAVGGDGSIWLKRESTGEPMADWWILSADGEPTGVVSIASGTRILAPAIDHAWATVLDDLDVPYIVRLSVVVPD